MHGHSTSFKSKKTTYLRSPPTPGKAPKQKAKQAKKNFKKAKQKAPKQLSNQLLYTEIDKYYKSIAI